MSFSRVLTALMVLVVPVILSACNSLSQEECIAADWRVIGETDGAAGKNPQKRFAAHVKSCEKTGILPNQTLWYEGFQVGITRYCTPLNGLQAGRQGKRYNNVCPVGLSEGYLRGYNLGKAFDEKRDQVTDFRGRIRKIEEDIRDVEIAMSNGEIGRDEGFTRVNQYNRDLDRLRYELSDRERELVRVERDIEIFTANPNMVLPPRRGY